MSEERYYRGVKLNKPEYWRDNGKPAAAAFQDDKGASTEKCNNRSTSVVIGSMKRYLKSKNAFYSVCQSHCDEVCIFIKPEPVVLEGDIPVPDHCLLLPEKDLIDELTLTQADFLAEKAIEEHNDKKSSNPPLTVSYT